MATKNQPKVGPTREQKQNLLNGPLDQVMGNLQQAGKVPAGKVFEKFVVTQIGDISKAKPFRGRNR